MTRGKAAQEGDEHVAANGYHYVYTGGKWRLRHHLVAEEKLGRPIDTKTERVSFKDGNRANFDPNNIVVKRKRGGKEQRIERLRSRITVMAEELAELDPIKTKYWIQHDLPKEL